MDTVNNYVHYYVNHHDWRDNFDDLFFTVKYESIGGGPEHSWYVKPNPKNTNIFLVNVISMYIYFRSFVYYGAKEFFSWFGLV